MLRGSAAHDQHRDVVELRRTAGKGVDRVEDARRRSRAGRLAIDARTTSSSRSSPNSSPSRSAPRSRRPRTAPARRRRRVGDRGLAVRQHRRQQAERRAGRRQRHGLAARSQDQVVDVAGADKRSRPSPGRDPASAAVTYFSGAVEAYSRSLAWRPASAARRSGRAARAASPACCSSRAPPAGPCPTTSATHNSRRVAVRRRRPAARRSSRRRTAAPAGCAPRARSRRTRGSAAGNRSAWMRAASVELALELRARDLRLLVQRQQPLALARRPGWCARTAARSRSRWPSAAPACSAASARRRCRPSACVLPSAITPITRSPTLSGAADQRAERRVVARRGAGRRSTSLTISATPLAAIAADDAVAAPELPSRRGSSSPKPATVVSAPVVLVEQHDHAVGGDDQVPRLLQRERARRARRRAAPPASRRSCRSG